jgi:hypothetical protein
VLKLALSLYSILLHLRQHAAQFGAFVYYCTSITAALRNRQ